MLTCENCSKPIEARWGFNRPYYVHVDNEMWICYPDTNSQDDTRYSMTATPVGNP